MERLHPVTSKQEVAVDIEVAAIIALDLHSKCFPNLWLVQPLANIAELRVTEIATIFAFPADVIDVLSSSLIWTHHSIVTVDGGGNAGPDAFAVITALNERLATRKSIVHSLAFAFAQNGFPSTFPTSHGSVVCVLRKTIGETVAN